MNHATSRRRLLIALAIGMLGIYAMLSVSDARSAALQLIRARGDLAEMQAKLSQLERLKQAPRIAALSLESPAAITDRISMAREAAGLPQASLLREQPMDPQRIGRSDFELRSITIGLAPSTLPQILAFCDALRDEESGTVVRDLRLSEPRTQSHGGGAERWEAEMVLTQMIFSPKSR